ncbi:MAG: response regulator [Chlamydiota bacterium]|nr:response regulator [Chlamydiota bacterium]
MRPRPLTTGDVAKHCHVTHVAVLKWIKAGKLHGYRTPGGHYRIEIQDFKKFLIEYGMPLDSEILSKSFKKILVIDDEQAMVSQICEMLDTNDKNYLIQSTTDPFEACIKLGSFKPDLVILDIKMPGIDGFQICSRIRNNPDIKHANILVITGFSDEENIRRIKEFGVEAILEKPIQPEKLIEKVQQLLA